MADKTYLTVEWLARNDWKGGQLLAFSALDGRTDYDSGLTARTAFDGRGLDVLLPARGRIRFPAEGNRADIVAGDWFELGTEPVVRGVLLDAHHLLIEGPCTVTATEPALAWRAADNRTLIGSACRFDPAKLTADMDAARRARRRWFEGGGRARRFLRVLRRS